MGLLGRSNTNPIETLAKWVGLVVSIGGFAWGIVSFLITNRMQAEAKSLEARKPFLDYQLQLYKEAILVTQTIATTKDPTEKIKKTERFWQLYWGELGLVENGGEKANGGVESAMVAFGKCMNNDTCSKDKLPEYALFLAHACRDSLAESWGVKDWKAPADQPSTH